jgi:uncharacterized protein YbaR (Trm112 family)
MFIELADHLRCPADHDEAFLVLLPDAMDGRSVVAGQLGCPVCGRTFRVERGELNVDGAVEPAAATAEAPGAPAASALGAPAMIALAGINGPGGYIVLVGAPAAAWREVVALIPGVGIVAVNPGAEVVDAPGVSVLRGGMLPLKAHSMRGVVLGPGYGGDAHWVGEAARVTLPGLRIVGEGPAPSADTIDLMASADGVWVGTRRR